MISGVGLRKQKALTFQGSSPHILSCLSIRQREVDQDRQNFPEEWNTLVMLRNVSFQELVHLILETDKDNQTGLPGCFKMWHLKSKGHLLV